MKLELYLKHCETYGPDQVVKTAAIDPDIDRRDLSTLASHIDYLKRTSKWTWDKKKRMGIWVPKSEKLVEIEVRQCLACGLDLPRSKNMKAQFHGPACKQKYWRRKERERKAREREERIAAARARRRAKKKEAQRAA